MNFLAHIYLSGDVPARMVGNFIGDFVKGKSAIEKYDPGIARGIELHRAIDAFTDTHPVVAESKNRLRPKYRHYSGVIIDVFYDHFLASNWAAYHPVKLHAFAQNIYRTIQNFDPVLPPDVKYMLPYMISGDWLTSYATVDGIHRALSGMARRTTFNSKMELARQDLIDGYGSFKAEFEAFFPDLHRHCEQKIVEFDQARS